MFGDNSELEPIVRASETIFYIDKPSETTKDLYNPNIFYCKLYSNSNQYTVQLLSGIDKYIVADVEEARLTMHVSALAIIEVSSLFR